MGVQSWPAGTLALPPCSAPSLGVFLITVLRGSGRWLDGVPAVSRVLSLLLQLPVSSLHGLQSFSVSLLVLFAILLQKSSSGSELMTVWTCSLSTASLAWSDSSSMHFSAQTTSLVSMVSTTESLVDGSTTTTSNSTSKLLTSWPALPMLSLSPPFSLTPSTSSLGCTSGLRKKLSCSVWMMTNWANSHTTTLRFAEITSPGLQQRTSQKTESNINPSDRHGIPQHSEMINGQSPEEGSSGHEHTGVMGDRHG